MNIYKSKKMKIEDSYQFAQMCMPIIILAVRAWRETPLHATQINCRPLIHTAQQTKTLNERRFNPFALRMAKIVNKFGRSECKRVKVE